MTCPIRKGAPNEKPPTESPQLYPQGLASEATVKVMRLPVGTRLSGAADWEIT